MPNNTRHLPARNASPVMFEALEGRELMSASIVNAAPVVLPETKAELHAELIAQAAAARAAAKAAVEEKIAAAKAAAQAKIAAAQAKVAAAKLAAQQAAAAKKAAAVETTVQPVASPISGTIGNIISTAAKSNVPNFVGTWTGTMQLDGSTSTSPFSINFTFQHGVAASGMFHLGPIMGNQDELSTLVFSAHNEVRALVQNSTIWAGFTGALSTNDKTLYGRFAYNTPKGWETGTFSVTLNA